MQATRAIALLMLHPLFIAGCAGSASPPPAYVAAADAICSAQLAQLNRLRAPTTPEQAISYLPQAVAIIGRERSGLAALDPPAALRAEVDAGLAGQGQLATLLRHISEELRSG